jgi:hypothetical protein
MGRVRKLVLREYKEENGGYWQYWYGSVPPAGARFRVTESEWGHEDGCPDPVRYITGWELADGAEG